MYRALTERVHEAGIDPQDHASVACVARALKFALRKHEGDWVVSESGRPLSPEALHTGAIDRDVLAVSAHSDVRSEMVRQQREIAAETGIVMLGRDIGTVVLPDAPVKLYVTATPTVRARRRHLQAAATERSSDERATLQEIRARDAWDETRPVSPLKPASDAVILDTARNLRKSRLMRLWPRSTGQSSGRPPTVAKPLVALVGRPNVGKSRLFNRLIGRRHAIVEDIPGTTRDRIYGEYEWNGRDVAVVDTGGLTSGNLEDITRSAMAQASVAIDDADVIVMVVDVRSGIMPLDEEVAARLRQSGKPVVLAVNKADNRTQMEGSVEFHALALGEPVAVSAERGLGTGELLDAIDAVLPPPESEPEDERITRLAIVGRPNVGKSSLVNSLLGENRVVVSDIPGTTRDAIDTEMRHHDQTIVLIDTAGIRRRGRIEQGIEKYSVLRAHRAIDRADVAALIVDATESWLPRTPTSPDLSRRRARDSLSWSISGT